MKDTDFSLNKKNCFAMVHETLNSRLRKVTRRAGINRSFEYHVVGEGKVKGDTL